MTWKKVSMYIIVFTNFENKSKIVLHNVLGGMVGQYALPENDGKVKLPVEELPAGVYFYTVYVDNQSVFTRKLMIRK